LYSFNFKLKIAYLIDDTSPRLKKGEKHGFSALLVLGVKLMTLSQSIQATKPVIWSL